MKKKWKIVLWIVFILAVLFVAFIGFVIYNGYQYVSFYNKAENLGTVIFSSELFNEELKNCELAYGGQSVAGESWEIRGLENNGKCLVVYREPKVNYDDEDSATISYISHVCELPYDIYKNPEKIDWNEIFNTNLCNLN